MYVAHYPFFQFASNIWALMLTTSQEITVTNYTGEATEYLKKLITAMGATFIPSMMGKTTVLIAALYVALPLLFPLPFLLPFFLLPPILSSSLLSSLFPITNPFHFSACYEQKQPKPCPFHPVHTWLQNCFVQRRNLTLGVETYIVFPPGVDFSTLLGESGVRMGRGIEEEAKEMGDDDDESGEREGMQEAETPSGTDASMRS